MNRRSFIGLFKKNKTSLTWPNFVCPTPRTYYTDLGQRSTDLQRTATFLNIFNEKFIFLG